MPQPETNAPEPVRSPRNKRVVDAARLRRAKDRKETGRTLVEGPHLVAELIRFGIPIETLFVRSDDTGSHALAIGTDTQLVVVDQQALNRVSDTEHPRGPVAVIRTPTSMVSERSVVVLWEIADPGNAGTVIRSAAAFGFDVIATGNGVDIWSPKAIRAGAGGHFAANLEVSPDLSLDTLRRRGLVTVACSGAGGGDASEIGDSPVAVLIGNEAHGLPKEIEAGADHRFTIPMPGGTESLNAATAASIALYAIGKRSR